jgi:hypothetical protein
MYYIQHKYHTWIEWRQWGAYPSEEEAKKSFDIVKGLKNIKPASLNGVDFYDSYAGYYYRLSSK